MAKSLLESLTIFQVRAVPTPVVEWRWQGQRIRNGSLTNVGTAVFIIREASAVGQRASNLTVVRADLEHGGEYVCVGKNSAGTCRQTPLLAYFY